MIIACRVFSANELYWQVSLSTKLAWQCLTVHLPKDQSERQRCIPWLWDAGDLDIVLESFLFLVDKLWLTLQCTLIIALLFPSLLPALLATVRFQTAIRVCQGNRDVDSFHCAIWPTPGCVLRSALSKEQVSNLRVWRTWKYISVSSSSCHSCEPSGMQVMQWSTSLRQVWWTIWQSTVLK